MIRLAALTAGVALLLSTGCTHDGEWSVGKALGWDDSSAHVVKPTSKEKEMAKLTPADQAVQQRVINVGSDILAKTTFTGIDPLFTAIGVKESVLFHIGPDRLYISQGLVEKCPSNAALAAVLCSELGQMVAEKRAAKALGRNVEPIPDVTTGDNALFPGGTPIDVGRQTELASPQSKPPKSGSRPEAADPVGVARDLLQRAGYSPAELDCVEPLLKLSPRSEQLRKQFGGSAPDPQWEK